jgi:hypothetical protein
VEVRALALQILPSGSCPTPNILPPHPATPPPGAPTPPCSRLRAGPALAPDPHWPLCYLPQRAVPTSATCCGPAGAGRGGAGEGVVRGAGPCAPFPDPCLHVPAWGCCSLQRISVKLGSGEPRPASVLGSRPERSLPASLPSPPSWTAPPLSEEPDFTLHSGLRRPSVCNNRFPHPPSPERFAPQGSAQRLLWEASVSQF